MPAALLVRLHPVTPWRFGSESGSLHQSDTIYHSDTLYSAFCSSFAQLGQLDSWLDATAHDPGIIFSSCFPFVQETLFITPPRTLWPPAHSAKVRWKGARFVPVSVVQSLLEQKSLSEDGWIVDGHSGCLLPVGRGGIATGPYRVLHRTGAAVDRNSGRSGEPSTAAVVEFAPHAGLWFLAAFASEALEAEWMPRLEGALALLADSGFGGLRSRGFGRCAKPSITRGEFPDLILRVPPDGRASWLLSLFSPAEGEAIDWSLGNYETVFRGGRIESPVSWGGLKRPLGMVREGSVLAAPVLRGSMRDVAPDGFPHPVYRSGFAFSIPIPWQGPE